MADHAAHHAEYDDIAAEYAASKQLPFRIVVEAPTLFGLAGDVSGLTVLDLPCGDGTYSRALARRGAASVTGVDLSSAMVERAEAAERDAPLGIHYEVGDAADCQPAAEEGHEVAQPCLDDVEVVAQRGHAEGRPENQ